MGDVIEAMRRWEAACRLVNELAGSAGERPMSHDPEKTDLWDGPTTTGRSRNRAVDEAYDAAIGRARRRYHAALLVRDKARADLLAALDGNG